MRLTTLLQEECDYLILTYLAIRFSSTPYAASRKHSFLLFFSLSSISKKQNKKNVLTSSPFFAFHPQRKSLSNLTPNPSSLRRPNRPHDRRLHRRIQLLARTDLRGKDQVGGVVRSLFRFRSVQIHLFSFLFFPPFFPAFWGCWKMGGSKGLEFHGVVEEEEEENKKKKWLRQLKKRKMRKGSI